MTRSFGGLSARVARAVRQHFHFTPTRAFWLNQIDCPVSSLETGMQMLRFFWDEAVALDPAVEPKDERHMKLSRQGQLGDLWRQAGLINIEEKPLVIDQTYLSFNDYWEPFTKGAGPGGAYVLSLSEDRRQQPEGRMRKRLLRDRQDGPFTLTAKAWCVRGEVPKP
jgi:hypothetical protein